MQARRALGERASAGAHDCRRTPLFCHDQEAQVSSCVMYLCGNGLFIACLAGGMGRGPRPPPLSVLKANAFMRLSWCGDAAFRPPGGHAALLP